MATKSDATGKAGTAVDDPIALGVASGKKLADVAKDVGVNVRTVQRRMKSPQFRARVHELRAQMLGEAAGRLTDGMAKAADELLALVGHSDADVRHKAAVKVIELGLRTREAVDVEERLAAVEAALREGKTDGDSSGPTGEGRSESEGNPGATDESAGNGSIGSVQPESVAPDG
jgi:hypothetical protein